MKIIICFHVQDLHPVQCATLYSSTLNIKVKINSRPLLELNLLPLKAENHRKVKTWQADVGET